MMMIVLAALLFALVAPSHAVAAKKPCRTLCGGPIAECVAAEIAVQCADTTGRAGQACAKIAKGACKRFTILRCKANPDGSSCLSTVTTTTTSPSVTTTTIFQGQPISLNSGDLLVTARGKIVRVDPTSGAQTVIASNDQHPNLVFGSGISIADDVFVIARQFSQGDVTDVVVRIDPPTGTQTIVSTGRFLAQQDDTLGLVAVDDDHLLVANQFGRLFHIDTATGEQHVLLSVGLVYPRGISFNAGGDVFVTNAPFTPFAGIAKVHVPNADFASGIGNQTLLSASLATPYAVVTLFDDIIISDNEARAILRMNATTGSITPISMGGMLIDPRGIEIATDGSIIVVDGSAPGKIVRVDATNGAQTIVATGGDIDGGVGVALFF